METFEIENYKILQSTGASNKDNKGNKKNGNFGNWYVSRSEFQTIE